MIRNHLTVFISVIVVAALLANSFTLKSDVAGASEGNNQPNPEEVPPPDESERFTKETSGRIVALNLSGGGEPQTIWGDFDIADTMYATGVDSNSPTIELQDSQGNVLAEGVNVSPMGLSWENMSTYEFWNNVPITGGNLSFVDPMTDVSFGSLVKNIKIESSPEDCEEGSFSVSMVQKEKGSNKWFRDTGGKLSELYDIQKAKVWSNGALMHETDHAAGYTFSLYGVNDNMGGSYWYGQGLSAATEDWHDNVWYCNGLPHTARFNLEYTRLGIVQEGMGGETWTGELITRPSSTQCEEGDPGGVIIKAVEVAAALLGNVASAAWALVPDDVKEYSCPVTHTPFYSTLYDGQLRDYSQWSIPALNGNFAGSYEPHSYGHRINTNFDAPSVCEWFQVFGHMGGTIMVVRSVADRIKHMEGWFVGWRTWVKFCPDG